MFIKYKIKLFSKLKKYVNKYYIRDKNIKPLLRFGQFTETIFYVYRLQVSHEILQVLFAL